MIAGANPATDTTDTRFASQFVASLTVFVAFLVWKFKWEQAKYDQQVKDLNDQVR